MKRIITALLLCVIMISLCACNNKDYTRRVSDSDYAITECYTSHGDIYQVIVQDRQTRITVITTYYWTTNDRGVQILDRTEVVRINEKGELLP